MDKVYDIFDDEEDFDNQYLCDLIRIIYVN